MGVAMKCNVGVVMKCNVGVGVAMKCNVGVAMKCNVGVAMKCNVGINRNARWIACKSLLYIRQYLGAREYCVLGETIDQCRSQVRRR